MYSFKNTETNENITVAFYTEDDFYEFMSNGCYLKTLNSSRLRTYTYDGVKYSFYNFSYISKQITDETKGTLYEYDDSIEPVSFDRMYYKTDEYILEDRALLPNRNELGNNWTLLIPEAYIYRISYEKNSGSDHTDYESKYVCAFRDLDGNIHPFTINDKYKKYDDTSKDIEYTSSFRCDDNKYLSFEKLYYSQELYANGPKYNFTVRDNNGLTYYLYDPEAKETEKPSRKQALNVVAVEDTYGNMIRYEYDSELKNLTKIVDTYGREVNINRSNNKTTISYYDDIAGENKSIYK